MEKTQISYLSKLAYIVFLAVLMSSMGCSRQSSTKPGAKEGAGEVVQATSANKVEKRGIRLWAWIETLDAAKGSSAFHLIKDNNITRQSKDNRQRVMVPLERLLYLEVDLSNFNRNLTKLYVQWTLERSGAAEDNPDNVRRNQVEESVVQDRF